MVTALRHALAAIAAVCCYLLCGCVVDALTLKIGPLPPYVDLTVLGVRDDVKPAATVPTLPDPVPAGSTEGAGTRPAQGPMTP